MTIEAVIFDMDGLMLDTEPLYKASWQRAAAELGFAIDDCLYRLFTGRPARDCERLIIERLGSGFPLDAFRARWPELWRAEAAGGILWKDGLAEILNYMDDAGLACAVATSSGEAMATFTLELAGLRKRFEIIVTGDQIDRGKPAPDIYLEAAWRLGIEPGRCMALEDSEVGIVAASTAGMMAVLIPEVGPPSAVATTAAARVLPSLHAARSLLEELM